MSDTATAGAKQPRWPLRPNSGRFAIGLFLVALVQTLALSWMIYDRVTLISSGKEIVLDTIPVDPRSLFRGDYVILNYPISSLNLTALKGDKGLRRGMKVFVTLRKPYRAGWQPVSVTKSFPTEIEKDHVVLRGKVRSGGDKNLRVNYGIEAYFVPEGEGKDLERVVREKKLQVLVAIGTNGEAAIKGLEVDGKRLHEETLF